jgi:hypothetical protein
MFLGPKLVGPKGAPVAPARGPAVPRPALPQRVRPDTLLDEMRVRNRLQQFENQGGIVPINPKPVPKTGNPRVRGTNPGIGASGGADPWIPLQPGPSNALIVDGPATPLVAGEVPPPPPIAEPQPAKPSGNQQLPKGPTGEVPNTKPPEPPSAQPRRVKQDVYIIGNKGDALGQLDIFEVTSSGERIFIEAKDGTKLGKINPKTGKPFEDPATELTKWADKQILIAGRKKATALRDGVATRGDKGASVPSIAEIKLAKKIRFEIQADTLELRLAVEARLRCFASVPSGRMLPAG